MSLCVKKFPEEPLIFVARVSDISHLDISDSGEHERRDSVTRSVCSGLMTCFSHVKIQLVSAKTPNNCKATHTSIFAPFLDSLPKDISDIGYVD